MTIYRNNGTTAAEAAAATAPARLVASHITKSFDGVKILDDVSIELREREIVSLLGVSGGGKTTLFNVISGLMKPEEGDVLLDGDIITGKAGQVSYMLQKDLLLPYYTVVDNVALPLLIRGVSKKEARAEAAKHFADFGLEGMEEKYPSQLSGGMRQRAALLRTYLFSDKVALLDEPFSALDYQTRLLVSTDICSLIRQTKKTVIIITHDLSEAISLADRIIVLSRRP
ncbi:MAG: ABC transporter ATP-binding protein, partial [Firmicutes bacterium]|nr:ABC transporter ATP-binding protein [Bacillota bacterium]